MKIPQRFSLIPAYLINAAHPQVEQPKLNEFLGFLSQPSKEARAARFIKKTQSDQIYLKIFFNEYPERPLFYPKGYRWVDFCQTVDECFNVNNWHHFLSPRFKLSENDIVVDCGAAEGLFSLYSAMHGAKVHAIEPDLGFVNAMCETFRALPNVEVHHCAVGHKTGTAFLSRNEIFSRIGSEGGGTEIAIQTLDDALAGGRITFLKADVEGFEFRVILGAEDSIRKHRPNIALTVYHYQNNVGEIQDFLKECCSDYQFATKGLCDNGHPVMFHAWVE